MSYNSPTAANDSVHTPNPACARRTKVTSIHRVIAIGRAKADCFDGSMVSVHLDHASAICLAEITKYGGAE